MIKMLKGQKKHIDKEQCNTKHEAPRSVNYRATQTKNNIGLKTFHCTNFTLGPDIILNTKKNKHTKKKQTNKTKKKKRKKQQKQQQKKKQTNKHEDAVTNITIRVSHVSELWLTSEKQFQRTELFVH